LNEHISIQANGAMMKKAAAARKRYCSGPRKRSGLGIKLLPSHPADEQK
jgi:hypothetical protein